MAEEGICVAIRPRPLNGRERIQGQRPLWRPLPEHNSITQTTAEGNPLPDRNPGFTFFTYDKVFSEDSSTQHVYEAIGRPIVSSVVEGFNGTIFAYGQTSSGKTHTMVGGAEGEEGILQLAARDIFKLISETSDRDFLLRVSFVEIYNENIRDLLDPETPALTVREDPRKGVYIEASEMIITDFDSILTALRTGSRHRRVEATAMNERSSRSHTIFRMVLESKARAPANGAALAAVVEGAEAEAAVPETNDVDGAVLVASLNLVDLAGSESVRHTGATGARAKEGGKINQSLLSLSRVIHALGQDGNVHVNFRDSKLTRILQPSLSGNAKMAVVCCITSAEKYMEETRSTLQFASRAKMVRTRAVINEVLDDRAQLKRLKKELQELKEKQKQLEAMGSSSALVSIDDLSRLEAEKQEMSGRVEELEAERQEQASKIDRLTNLILHGGGMGMMTGAKAADGMGPRGGRRPRRLRETWCPGESGVPMLKALQELVDDDEADDRLVSKLNFGRLSKRRTGSSSLSVSSSAAGRLTEEPLFEGASPEYSEEPAPVVKMETCTEQANAQAELDGIKEALSRLPGFSQEDGVLAAVQALVEAEMNGKPAAASEPVSMETDQVEDDAKVKCLEEQVEAMRSEIEAARQEQAAQREQMSAEVEQWRAVAEGLDSTVKALQEQLAERDVQLEQGASGAADKAALEERLAEAIQEVERLGACLAEQESAVASARAIEQAAKDIEQSAEQTVAELRQALEQQQAEATAALEELRSNLQQATEALAQRDAAIEQLSFQLANVQGETESISGMMAEKEAAVAAAEAAALELEQLRGQLAGQAAQAAALVEAMQEKDNTIALLEEAHARYESEREESRTAASAAMEDGDLQVQQLTAEVAQAHAQLSALMETVATKDASLESYKAANERLEAESAMLRQQLEEAAAEVQRMAARQQEEAAQMAEAVSDFRMQLMSALALNEEQQSLVEVVALTCTELAARGGRLSELEEETRVATERVAELQEKLEAAANGTQSQMSNFESQLSEAQKALEYAQVEKAAMEEDVEKRGAEVAKLREEMAALEEELATAKEALSQIALLTSEGAMDDVEQTEEGEGLEMRTPAKAPNEKRKKSICTTPLSPELALLLKKARPSVEGADDDDEEVEDEAEAEEEEERVDVSMVQDIEKDQGDELVDEAEAADEDAVMEGGEEQQQVDESMRDDVEQEAEEPEAVVEATAGERHEELARLREQVEELQGAVETQRQAAAELQEAVRAREEEIAGLRDEMLRAKEQQLESEVSAEEALSVKEETIADLTARLTAAEGRPTAEELEQTREQAQQMAAELEALNAQLAAATAELEALQASVADERTQAAERVESLSAGMAAKEAEVEGLRAQVAALQQAVEEQTAAVASKSEAQVQVNMPDESMAAQLKEALDNLESLSQELSEVTEDLLQKDSELSKERRRAEELAAACADFEARMVTHQRDTSESEDSAPSTANKQAHAALLNEQNARAEVEAALGQTSEQLGEAKEELRHTQDRVDALLKEIEELHAAGKREQERMQAELALKEADVAKLSEQLECVAHELKVANEELAVSRSVLANHDDAGLRKRQAQLQTQLDLAQSIVGKHEARIKELEAERQRIVRDAEHEQERLRREIEMAGKATSHIGEKDAEIRSLKEAYTALTNKVTSLKEQRDEAQQRAEQAVQDLLALEDEATQLREQAATNDQRAEQAKEDMALLQEDASRLREQAAMAQQRAEQAAEELSALRAEAAQLREQAASSEQAGQGSSSMSEDEIEQLRELAATNHQRAQQAAQELSALRTEAAELRELAAQREQRAQQTAEELYALQTETAQLREEAATHEQKGGEAAQELSALQQEAEELRKQATVSQQRADEAVQALSALQDEAAQLREQAASSEQKAAQAADQVSALEQEAAQLREQVALNAERLEALRARAASEERERANADDLIKELNSLLEAKGEAESRAAHLEREGSDLRRELKALLEAKVEAESFAKHIKQEADSLREEQNAMLEAKTEAESRAAHVESMANKLREALEAAQAEVVRARSQGDGVAQLKAQLEQKEQEYNTVYGESYRLKRELSELKEAAEDAIKSQVGEVDRLKATVAGKEREVRELEALVEDQKADIKAKDERIAKLDAVKMTNDWVNRFRRYKAERDEYAEENARIKQELETLRAGVTASSEAVGSADATISKLMAAREDLADQLRASNATCRKLELERTSIIEALQEIPTDVQDVRFSQVPEDLGVAVGVLVERLVSHVAEGRNEASKTRSDRSLLIKELNTLADEKEVLKMKVRELSEAAEKAQQREIEMESRLTHTMEQCRELEEQASESQKRVRELEIDQKAKGEEHQSQIRFLEKENLELMMDIKNLKERIVKLQTEVGVLRGEGGAAMAMPAAPPAPTAMTTPMHHTAPLSTASAASQRQPEAKVASVSKQPLQPSKASSAYRGATQDKENMVIGENLLSLKSHDDTAPPCRSMSDDEPSSGCAQS